MTSNRRNLMVGATVLGGGLIVSWMILEFSSKTAAIFAPPQIPVHFVSNRADGLSQGSQVLYLGVDVGRVTSLARAPEGVSVRIDADIDRNPPMPANLRAQIVQTNALGGASVISLDVDGQPPQGSLQPGATLRAEYTGMQVNLIPPSVVNTARQIGDMSEEVRKAVQQLRETGAIGDLDTTIKNINAKATKAGDLLDSLQAILGDPQTQSDLKVAIAKIRATAETTDHIASRLDALAASLQRSSDAASATIADSQKHIDDLSKQLGDRLTQISSLLTSVQSVAEKIDKGQGTAGQLLNDPKLYQALVDSSRELNATVADLKRLVEQWEQEGVTLHVK